VRRCDDWCSGTYAIDNMRESGVRCHAGTQPSLHSLTILLREPKNDRLRTPLKRMIVCRFRVPLHVHAYIYYPSVNAPRANHMIRYSINIRPQDSCPSSLWSHRLFQIAPEVRPKSLPGAKRLGCS
jgi:hypothetical protein